MKIEFYEFDRNGPPLEKRRWDHVPRHGDLMQMDGTKSYIVVYVTWVLKDGHEEDYVRVYLKER